MQAFPNTRWAIDGKGPIKPKKKKEGKKEKGSEKKPNQTQTCLTMHKIKKKKREEKKKKRFNQA